MTDLFFSICICFRHEEKAAEATHAAQIAAERAKAKGKEVDKDEAEKLLKTVDEGKIRKALLEELHGEMDKQIAKRQYRLKQADVQRDTDRQWDLIAAAVEQANIDWHGLTGDDAKRMRCRSRVTFIQDTANVLKKYDKVDVPDEKLIRVEALSKIADEHTIMSNKLTSIARRMIATQRMDADTDTKEKMLTSTSRPWKNTWPMLQ